LQFDKLAAITGGTIYNTDVAQRSFTGVAGDSRNVGPGQLFVAIRGERNDGHDYIDDAIAAGASGLVVEYDWPGLTHVRGDVAVIAVPNSHEAMLSLAAAYRDRLTGPIVAITGSNGKTTTKELTFHLLNAVTSPVYRSPGNLNNLFGVPLALFGVPQNAAAVVLELGISTEQEMPRLARIVRPDLVAITNVGPSHLEFLSSVESVAQAKLELVRSAAESVPVIINGDDDILVEQTRATGRSFKTFALDREADFSVDSIEPLGLDGTAVTIDGRRFALPLIGRHQVANLLAAYAIVRTLGFSFDNIDTESIALSTAPMRGQIVVHRGVTFLSDCYNANPDSVTAGLQSFFSLSATGRRTVILGDMLELGAKSERYHRQIGRQLAEHEFDLAVFVGPMSHATYEELLSAGRDASHCLHFKDAASCAERVNEFLAESDFVYIKASRGVGLEVVIDRYAGKGENA